MTYAYICPHCEKQTVINKPMSESDRAEYCEVCEGGLKRVYESPMISTADGVKS